MRCHSESSFGFSYFKTLLAGLLVATSIIFLGCSGDDSGNEKTVDTSETKDDSAGDSNSAAVDPVPKKQSILRRDGLNLSIAYQSAQSGGSDPQKVAGELIDIGQYHIFALSNVDKIDVYSKAFKKEWENYDTIEGKSGRNKDEEDDHLIIVYDPTRLYAVSSNEIDYKSELLQDEHIRKPLVAHFRERSDDSEFLFILNDFETDPALQKEQTKELRAWIESKPQPAVIVGTFNFNFNISDDKANDNFDSFVAGGVFDWIKPLKPADTQWMDADGDGKDDQADTITDFAFLSGRAKKWESTSRVKGDERDFPDDDRTSNHRPIEVLLRK